MENFLYAKQYTGQLENRDGKNKKQKTTRKLLQLY